MSILACQGPMSLLECVLFSIFNSFFCISIVVSSVFRTSASNNQCFSTSLVLIFYHLNQFFQAQQFLKHQKTIAALGTGHGKLHYFKILNSHGKIFQFAMKLPLGNKPEKHCSGMKNGYNKYIQWF